MYDTTDGREYVDTGRPWPFTVSLTLEPGALEPLVNVVVTAPLTGAEANELGAQMIRSSEIVDLAAKVPID